MDVAAAAREFATTYLAFDSVVDYLSTLLRRYAELLHQSESGGGPSGGEGGGRADMCMYRYM